MNRTLSLSLLLTTVLLGTACARASEEAVSSPATATATTTASAVAVAAGPTIDPELPLAIVHKTASCGCCGV